MNYIILETQTSQDGTVGTLVYSFTDENQAESKYHEVLQYAAISKAAKHAAFFLTDDGIYVKSERYYHDKDD